MRHYKNILVTGGCGFIGSNFINLILNENDYIVEDINIINIDKLTYAGSVKKNANYKDDKRYKFIEADIVDENLISSILVRFNIDVIINFAAESHVDNSITAPDSFIQTNILGTYNLLKCLNAYNLENSKNALFFHISTDEVFGSLKNNDPGFNESNQYKPNSPYSASKASSDHLVRAWFKTYKLPVLITNCSNNYGPNQDNEKLIPKIIKNAINKEIIPIYGDGMNIRDWLYVEDHCRAIIKVLMEGGIGETYNIGGLNEISNIDITNKICEILENLIPFNTNPNPSTNKKLLGYKDLITFVKDRAGHDFRYAIDPIKIEKNLNWKPSETFESGITKTVKWYLKQFGQYDY
jgi:dTDP-glucose 4,6-dehydratase